MDISGNIQLDTTEWVKAVKQFAKGTKFEGAKSINSSMASILYKSPHSVIKKTYRQTKTGIRKDIRSKGDDFIINMAIDWLRSKGRPINDTSVGLAAQTILLARWKSAKYIVAGWASAARDFGATKIREPGSRSEASKGYGEKATDDNLTAVAVNAVGSEIVDGRVYADVTQTMQDAVDKEAKALVRNYEKRLVRLANKHSGDK